MAHYIKFDTLNNEKIKVNTDKVLFVTLYTDNNGKKHIRIVYSNDMVSDFTENINVVSVDYIFNLFTCHGYGYDI